MFYRCRVRVGAAMKKSMQCGFERREKIRLVIVNNLAVFASTERRLDGPGQNWRPRLWKVSSACHTRHPPNCRDWRCARRRHVVKRRKMTLQVFEIMESRRKMAHLEERAYRAKCRLARGSNRNLAGCPRHPRATATQSSARPVGRFGPGVWTPGRTAYRQFPRNRLEMAGTPGPECSSRRDAPSGSPPIPIYFGAERNKVFAARLTGPTLQSSAGIPVETRLFPGGDNVKA